MQYKPAVVSAFFFFKICWKSSCVMEFAMFFTVHVAYKIVKVYSKGVQIFSSCDFYTDLVHIQIICWEGYPNAEFEIISP